MDSPEIKIVEETVIENFDIEEAGCFHLVTVTATIGESSGSSSSCNQMNYGTLSLQTENGTMDCAKPSVKSTTGGKRIAALLLVSYGLANFAFFGVAVNLVVFLRQVFHQENAEAANNVSKWMGTVYIFSLVGAFLSDSYLGRYLTCIVFQIIYIAGLLLLSLTTWFVLEEPAGCGDGDGHIQCAPPSRIGVLLFYLSIYTVALGNGGYQPSVATFGADQFEETDSGEWLSKQAFFCFFYLSLNIGSLFSNSVLVFYEDRGMWVMGFSVATAAAVLALLLFLLGTPHYRHYVPTGNPLTRILQVFVAAYRKRHIRPPPGEDLHEVEGEDGGIQGVRKLLHRNQLRFLDKAATPTEEDYHAENAKNPWRLCTVTQVEEVKCILSIIPIWMCTIVYSLVFTQMSSTFVEQGAAMDTNLFGKLKVPAAAMSVADIVSVLISAAVYRYIIVPVTSRFTRTTHGMTELQRMGTGLAIALLGMVAAGLVEAHRLRRAGTPSALSVLWQAPQYALIGASEVFMYVGQLEFFSGQVPDGVKGFGSSLWMASISLGNYSSILAVAAVNGFTAAGSMAGWIPADINSGHLDSFFLVLAALSGMDLVVFVIFAMRYKGIKLEERGARGSFLERCGSNWLWEFSRAGRQALNP